MKLKQNPYICPHCYDKISTFGWPCFTLIDLTVGHYFYQSNLILNEQESHDPIFKIPLEYLEKKGYVISTENDDNSIQVMPNLSKAIVDYEKHVLCWCIKD